MRKMFSEKQIKRMIQESPEEVIEALQGQDLKVKTLEQSNPNWSLDISEIQPTTLPEGVSYSCQYGKLEVINGVLFLVLSYALENTTDASKSVPNMSIDVVLPENIAEKIIDIKGKSVKETAGNDICIMEASRGDTSYPEALNRVTMQHILANTTTANKMAIRLFGWGSISANQKQYACARLVLTIL